MPQCTQPSSSWMSKFHFGVYLRNLQKMAGKHQRRQTAQGPHDRQAVHQPSMR